MRRILRFFAALLAIASFFILSPGCRNYKEVDIYPACDTTYASYSGNVSPIFSANCMPCHNINNKFFGINLDVLDSARIPARNSLLLKAVTHDPSVSPMPRGGPKLSDCNISKIRRWINLSEPPK